MKLADTLPMWESLLSEDFFDACANVSSLIQ